MIIYTAFLTICALIFQLWVFPSFPFLIFTPLCFLVYQRKGRVIGLWVAALTGLFFDFILFDTLFGLHSLFHTLIFSVIFIIQNSFFRNLPIFSGTFSIIYRLFFLVLVNDQLTLSKTIEHLVILPLADIIFVFFWFTCPLMLYNRVNGANRYHLRSRT